jgi:hypothetical protein
MDDGDDDGILGSARPLPARRPPRPRHHHLEPDRGNDDGDDPQLGGDHEDPGAGPFYASSSLASEAYLAVRDFLAAAAAEARGDRGAAAAHAAAAASRVQTAVEAEGALPRGDFGPVCDILATAFAWKAQVGFFGFVLSGAPPSLFLLVLSVDGPRAPKKPTTTPGTPKTQNNRRSATRSTRPRRRTPAARPAPRPPS